MASMPFPLDQAIRDRIRTDLQQNLFVEAGAGTGKTTSLVDRVVELVSSGITTLDQVAAITFTEAAAAELRDKIREGMERAAQDPDLDSPQQDRCRRGAADLDQASIQTLHGFAANLLQERPLEAGLPPSFEIMDSISSQLAFQEAWTRWLDQALEDGDLADEMSLAFSLGLNPGHLRDVAVKFHDEYDELEDVTFADVPQPGSSVVSELAAAESELERLCKFSQLGESDRLFSHAHGLLGSIRRLSELTSGSVAAYRTLQRMLPLKHRYGRLADWDDDPKTGQNACRYLKSYLEYLDQRANEELAQVRARVIVPILRSLQAFGLEYASERKRQGRAEFHDLLVWTRNLLRDNLEVRDHFRGRFSHLLIDEAQDTDPIQAEIALFLAEEMAGSVPANERPRSWREIRPEAGKLFVVGDPKQSIYRFRRADIAQMNRLREALNGDTVRLVQNFRAHRPVLDWVNHVFQEWMARGTQQTEYVPLAHWWEVSTDHPLSPGVWSLGGAQEDTRIDPVREKESRGIAGLLRQIVDNSWQVLDSTLTSKPGEEHYRSARYSDICVLMPRRTGLRSLELALDEAGLPYRLEGASLIFGTQEVRDLVNCLWAIDDPADQVALVAALRSPAFACSDVDLLDFVQQGGKLSYLVDNEVSEGTVADAFQVLQRYHQEKFWTSTTGLIDGFLRERKLMEAALEHPRPREQWRRYRFMVEQARAFAGVGGDSLRGFLEWVESQAAEGARVTEVPVPEGDDDALRIMTVHAAKGLEFPVVLLTGLNNDSSPRIDTVLLDREGSRVEVRIGPGDYPFSTEGYEEMADRERGLAENEYVRLLYVAATRARDHLIISMYRTAKDEKSAAATIGQIMVGHDGLWEPVSSDGQPRPEASAAPAITKEPQGHSLETREEWLDKRRNMLQRQSRPVAVAATTLAQVAKAEVAAEEPWKRGRGGTSLGRAVHAVLQTVDLANGFGLEETARAQATAEGIPNRAGEIQKLAQVALDSQVVRRAVASGRLWREVPVAAPVGETVLEGFIDLLFEEGDGLVVVDYKTDVLDTEEEIAQRGAHYRIQAGAYVLALQEAIRRPVREVVLLFLQPSQEVLLRDVSELVVEARGALLAT